MLIFSQPKKQKLQNIRQNPRVTLALDETNGGHDVVIVEGEVGLESTSLTLTRLSSLSIHAFFQAGHLFCPQRDGLTQELNSLVARYGVEHVQTCVSSFTHHAGTPEWQSFCENVRLGFQVIAPFLRKWTRLSDDYPELTRQAVREINEPSFAATVRLLTVWGKAACT